MVKALPGDLGSNPGFPLLGKWLPSFPFLRCEGPTVPISLSEGWMNAYPEWASDMLHTQQARGLPPSPCSSLSSEASVPECFIFC